MMRQIGQAPDGTPIHAIPLAAGALRAEVMTLGAGLWDVRIAGRDYNLTRRPDDIAAYLRAPTFDGVIVGPVANRIGGARAALDGTTHQFEANEHGANTLHSGSTGVHGMVWSIAERSARSVTLTLDLPDGLGGFPGNRTVRATYSVGGPARLRLEITGTTDAPTWMNPANHAYWNLDGGETWAGHSLRVAAGRLQALDPDLIPTGGLIDVAGTEMDFRQPRAPAPGAPPLDHNFCLADARRDIAEALWLTGASGLAMTLATTEPGVQVYDGRPGYGALAIEAQGWPDAPNHAHFPSIRLDPGETYRQITEWRFG